MRIGSITYKTHNIVPSRLYNLTEWWLFSFFLFFLSFFSPPLRFRKVLAFRIKQVKQWVIQNVDGLTLLSTWQMSINIEERVQSQKALLLFIMESVKGYFFLRKQSKILCTMDSFRELLNLKMLYVVWSVCLHAFSWEDSSQFPSDTRVNLFFFINSFNKYFLSVYYGLDVENTAGNKTNKNFVSWSLISSESENA